MIERGRVVIDRIGVIVDLDPLFCKTLRSTADVLLGTNMLDYTAPADRERCMHLMERVLIDGRAISTTKRLIRTDESHLWVQSTLSMHRASPEPLRLSVVMEESPLPAGGVKPEALLKTAKVTLEGRRARSEIFCASLFSDSAWDILLAAYISESEGAVLTMPDLVVLLGVSPANLTRWMRALAAKGLVEYEAGDGGTPRDAAFRLSCDAHQRFERYLSQRYVAALSATITIERPPID